jgi:hypothetical protein
MTESQDERRAYAAWMRAEDAENAARIQQGAALNAYDKDPSPVNLDAVYVAHERYSQAVSNLNDAKRAYLASRRAFQRAGGHVPLGVAGVTRDKSLIDRMKKRNADQQPSDNTENFEMS